LDLFYHIADNTVAVVAGLFIRTFKVTKKMKYVEGLVIWAILGVMAWALVGCISPVAAPTSVIPPIGGYNGTQTIQVVTRAMNLPWLVVASSLGITLGIVGLLFAPGPLKTIAGVMVVGCAIFLGLMLLIAAYAKWFAFGALGLVIACVIYAVVNKKWLEAEVKEHLLGGKKV
jgi:hypothetical protein